MFEQINDLFKWCDHRIKRRRIQLKFSCERNRSFLLYYNSPLCTKLIKGLVLIPGWDWPAGCIQTLTAITDMSASLDSETPSRSAEHVSGCAGLAMALGTMYGFHLYSCCASWTPRTKKLCSTVPCAVMFMPWSQLTVDRISLRQELN